ncbi:MAG: hypothetical protein CO189_04970 [candidate division Zixibacteria bacterium CG_4_9_14_3_um_filter_46_8]|nr:MAG: hypothetical protein CO189_04970 [candidate division Zixibacteria bacterium CG_4_9_14_3_um_filter_46_8]
MLWLRKSWLIIIPSETPQNINYAAERIDFPLLKLPLFSFIFIIPFAFTGIVVAWCNRECYFPFYAFIIAYSLTMIIYFVIRECEYAEKGC